MYLYTLLENPGESYFPVCFRKFAAINIITMTVPFDQHALVDNSYHVDHKIEIQIISNLALFSAKEEQLFKETSMLILYVPDF